MRIELNIKSTWMREFSSAILNSLKFYDGWEAPSPQSTSFASSPIKQCFDECETIKVIYVLFKFFEIE